MKKLHMSAYHEIIRELIDRVPVRNRTDVKARPVFSRTLEFDLREGFPLLTTKKVPLISMVSELVWFIEGSTNIRRLLKLMKGDDFDPNEHTGTIWDEWADDKGFIGPMYGHQWRRSGGCYIRALDDDLLPIENPHDPGVDQLAVAVETIKKNPNSRRIIVDSWDPSLLPDESIQPRHNPPKGLMALAPCHFMFQFNVEGQWLDLRYDARSQDIFLGTPFNISSYALLLHLVAASVDLKPRMLTAQMGNVHLYDNHLEQAKELLKRYDAQQDGEVPASPVPQLNLDPIKAWEILDVLMLQKADTAYIRKNIIDRFSYEPMPIIPAPRAV